MARTRKKQVEEEPNEGLAELDQTFGAIAKRYGDGLIRTARAVPQPVRISTGVFMLDFALLGGMPTGRISMLLGAKHGGKSMMASKITSNAQRQFPDQRVVFVDVEETFEPTWAEQLGVNVDELHVLSTPTGEIAVDMVDAMVQTDGVSLVVVDSLAALLPSREAESSAEDSHVGLQSRLIGGLCRRINGGIAKERARGHNISVLFINQYRTKIGVMFGDPRTAPGGHAVEHFPSLIVQMKNKEKIGKDEETDIETVVENEHSFSISKNKLNGGPRTGEFRVVRTNRPNEGLTVGDVDEARTMLAYAKKFGVYSGGGQSWTLAYAEYEHKFRSAGEASLFLNTNPDVKWSLRNYLIREQAIHLGVNQPEFLESFEV